MLGIYLMHGWDDCGGLQCAHGRLARSLPSTVFPPSGFILHRWTGNNQSDDQLPNKVSADPQRRATFSPLFMAYCNKSKQLHLNLLLKLTLRVSVKNQLLLSLLSLTWTRISALCDIIKG